MVFKEFFKPFLSNLLETVIHESLADGVITPEESVLLAQIEVDIRAFEKDIAQHITETGEEGGGITEELDQEGFKRRLIASVRKLALEDGKLTQDEEAIITKLEEYFSQPNPQ